MNGYLTTILPPLRKLPFHLSRDTAALLFVAVNDLMLGLETGLAHSISGTIRPNEWIPVLFSPPAGLLLLVAVWIGRRRPVWGHNLALLPLLGNVIVGGLGTYFHLLRAAVFQAPPGEQFSVPRLIWSPPLIAPPAFILVGLLGLIALWREEPPESGRFRSLGRWQVWPVTKSQLYFLIASLGVLIATTSSVMDHARTGFVNPWLWIPTLGGIFGTVVAFALGFLHRPSRADLLVYALAMGLQLAIGPTGMLLHILDNLATGNVILIERFIRQAPLLAPMVFANMGLLGILALLDPAP